MHEMLLSPYYGRLKISLAFGSFIKVTGTQKTGFELEPLE